MSDQDRSLEAWLARAGLGEVAETLANHDIDLDILRELSEQDLKEMGLSIGLRRRLQKAVREDAGAADPTVDIAPPARAAPDETQAERRHVTVVFVDLVGSTQLSTMLDPEELRDLIGSYQDAVAGVIARFGGHVAKFMGDGVLAYFGWPRVREGEVEIALRASLGALAAVSRLPSPNGGRLTARVGCACGLVVVGDLIGKSEARERTIVGDTPNLAARLQDAAAPGELWISEAVARLVGRAFETEATPPLALKGFAAPQVAYRVLSERQLASRFELRQVSSLGHALLGRDSEIAMLLDRWRLASVGDGNGVLLLGEAGIGKSRLTSELLKRLRGEKHTRLRYQCSPYYQETPLWPIGQQIRRAAGLNAPARSRPKKEVAPSDAQSARERLKALLALGAADPETSLPAIAELTAVDVEDEAFLELPASVRRERTQTALIAQVIGLSQRQPVLVVLEDAHWADPSTMELFELLHGAISGQRVLVLTTSRPENAPRLAQSNVTHLALARLDQRAVTSMIEHVLAGSGTSQDIVAQIAKRTDGVPLYIEELTKAVLESQQDASGGAAIVPASLHDSLMARLDRLPEVRDVAQIAACIGREFERSLLLTVSGRSEAYVDRALQRLVGAELVFRHRQAETASYMFKHALVRDAAYESLLKSRRRAIHQAIVAALIADGEAAPALIARHAADAGDAQRAIAAYADAGRQATQRGANAEAISACEVALDLVKQIPENERERTRLDLEMSLSVPLIAERGYAAPEVERLHVGALQRADSLGADAYRFQITRGLWNCIFDRGDLLRSSKLAQDLVRMAEDSGRGDWLRLAWRALGSNLMNEGKLRGARQALENVLGAFAPWSKDTTLFEHGEDPETIARLYVAWITAVEGRVDTGLRLIDEALTDAERLALPIAWSFARSIRCNVLSLRGDTRACLENAEVGLRMLEDHDIPFWRAHLTVFQGWAKVHCDADPSGVDLALRGVAAWKATGAILHVSTWNSVAADAALHLGQQDVAATCLDEALDYMARTGEGFAKADIMRLNARRLMAAGDRDAAVLNLRESLALSNEQGANLYHLRAARDLALLTSRESKEDDIATLLSSALASMNEGFDTRDQVEARELLDALR